MAASFMHLELRKERKEEDGVGESAVGVGGWVTGESTRSCAPLRVVPLLSKVCEPGSTETMDRALGGTGKPFSKETLQAWGVATHDDPST